MGHSPQNSFSTARGVPQEEKMRCMILKVSVERGPNSSLPHGPAG